MTSVIWPVPTPKRLCVGGPLRSSQSADTLLPKRLALPVFCSDPLSSVVCTSDAACTSSTTGAGVPERDRERVFAPFQRLGDRTPAAAGSGSRWRAGSWQPWAARSSRAARWAAG